MKGLIMNEYDLWSTLLKISNSISNYEKQVFSKYQITNQQFIVLMTMALFAQANKTPIIVSDLQPHQNRSLASISLIIDRMENKGLVKRLKDLSDKRSVRLVMTKKGKQIFRESSIRFMELVKSLMSIFNDKELETAIFLLKKMEGRLEKLHDVEVKMNLEAFTSQEMVNLLNKAGRQ